MLLGGTSLQRGVEQYERVRLQVSTPPPLFWMLWKNEMTNLIDGGVIDPIKVTRVALQNAASCAGGVRLYEKQLKVSPRSKPCKVHPARKLSKSPEAAKLSSAGSRRLQ